MTVQPQRLKTGSKAVILLLLLSLQSCALLTSYKKFSLDREPGFTFDNEKTFSGGNGFMVFYEDGTFLLIGIPTRGMIESHLEDVDHNIYERLSLNFFHWGVYRVEQDSVEIELLEKVDQFGFMGITRWNGVLKKQGTQIEILPGPVNRKGRNVYAPTFDYEGGIYLQDSPLKEFNIDPAKAWVNR